MACGHYFDEEGSTWKEFHAFDAPEGLGAGSVVTTVDDLLKWVRALMFRHGPITEDIYTELTKPRTIVSEDMSDLDPYSSPTLYALGWEIYWYRGHQVVTHDGLIQGFGSTHFFIPSVGFGACILGNAAGIEDIVFILARELIDAALGVPQSERPDWEAIWSARVAKGDEEQEQATAELRERLKAGDAEHQVEVEMPDLATLAGDYWNIGYHNLTVEVDGDRLFADGTDRSMPIMLSFEPMRA